jgi:hypothetical protein
MTPDFTPWLDHLPLRGTPASNTRRLQWFQSIFAWLDQHNYTLDDPTGIHEGHALLFNNDCSFVKLSLHTTFHTRPAEPGITIYSQDESWEASIGYYSHITTALFLLNSLQHNPDHT